MDYIVGFIQFLRCVLGQEYHAAKILCEYSESLTVCCCYQILCVCVCIVLRFEPDNATAREFYPTIMERIRLGEQLVQ